MREQTAETNNQFIIPPDADRLVGPIFDTDDSDLKNANIELYKTLDDFCGNLINEFTFSSAMLSDAYSKKDDATVGNSAKRTIRDCLVQCDTQKEAKYVLGLLEDESSINNFWQENSPNIVNNEDGEVDEWMAEDNLIDFEQLSKLIRNINLESLLICSAKTLNFLRENNEKTPEVLDKIRQAESMLAPICEIIGFDGLAMALNNASIITRFNNTGRGYFVEQATQLIDMYGSSETLFDAMKGSMKECLGHDAVADYDYAVNSKPEDPVHRTVFFHGLAYSESAGGEVDIKGRLKTVGSLAKKLYDSYIEKGYIEIPMDIMATTIVTSDVDQSAKVFDLIINNSKDNPSITPLPSPSKASAAYVQGEPGFVKKITANHQKNDSIDTKIVSAEDGVQVAKVTFEYKLPQINTPLRMEVQIVTLADRMSMRYGARCHSFAYKGKTKLHDITLRLLDKIHSRKGHIGAIDLIASNGYLDSIYDEIMNIDKTDVVYVGSTAVGAEVKLS